MRHLSYLALLLLLTACGGPRYTLVNDYTPPGDAVGRQCLQGCYADQKQCGLDCERGHNQCLDDARIDAEHSYAEKYDFFVQGLRNYNAELETYYADLDRYQQRKYKLEEELEVTRKLCAAAGKDSALFCERKDKLKKKLKYLYSPVKPAKPAEPSLEAETAKLQATCRKDCGCDSNYQRCYTSCGGKVEQRRICVSGCEKDKQ